MCKFKSSFRNKKSWHIAVVADWPSAATDSPELFVLAAEGVELLLLPGVALDPGEELLCGEADLWESLLATLASSGWAEEESGLDMDDLLCRESLFVTAGVDVVVSIMTCGPVPAARGCGSSLNGSTTKKISYIIHQKYFDRFDNLEPAIYHFVSGKYF